MPKPKWIRGKALQTVIGLGEIRVGDEVMLRACDNGDHFDRGDVEYFDEPLMVIELDAHPFWPVELARPGDKRRFYCTCFCGIAAWRRPNAKA